MNEARLKLYFSENKIIESAKLDLINAQENSNRFLGNHELKMALLKDDTSTESSNR